MKKIIFISLVFLSFKLKAQPGILRGNVVDEKANSLAFATVALLNPADSTLAFFGVSNTEGYFEIKNIASGDYLLQIAYMGYQTFYKKLSIPIGNNDNMGALVMQPLPQNLKSVEIVAENIPIQFKKDTIEYNAASFKTKPDAVVEDLLKKLPGVEVDRAGNIKAQGKDVQKVLVDGKEFLGNDPKVATKNLPADAIKKVQSFYKKSDQAEFTGIDDGVRDNTLNLVLKDDKKEAFFGDVQAGYGTDDHYHTSAKMHRFKKKSQLAGLGMLNNINQFGFTFQDYLNYSGGIQSLVAGNLSIDDAGVPINFGKPVTGLVTSGAGGINYTYEPKKNNRFNISYMANGSNKKLNENTYSRNFTDSSSFVKNNTLLENAKNRDHRVNFSWRNRLDSTQNLIVSGDVRLMNSKTNSDNYTENFSQNTLLNSLASVTKATSNGVLANAKASYTKTYNSSWKFFKLSGDFSGKRTINQSQWENISHYFNTNDVFTTQPFQNNNTSLFKYSANTSLTRKIMERYYLEMELNAGTLIETLERRQGVLPAESLIIDSLSPNYARNYQWLRPALNLSRNSKNTQLTVSARIEMGELNSGLQSQVKQSRTYFYFVPKLSLVNEYKSGRRVNFYYDSQVNTPTAKQLLTVVDNTNPLQLYIGNSNLRPEYVHHAFANWAVFDQFSFTSFMLGLDGAYTHDKINWSKTITNNLNQSLTLMNVPNDYRLGANADFSTPIKKLGVNIDLDFREDWNRGINFVNGIENINTNNSHNFTVGFNNRKKEKWDASVGANAGISNATYSVEKSLNNRYYNMNYFAEIGYTPNSHWRFFASVDVSQYNSKSFNNSITIPLVRAEATRYFLKANRGVLTLECFDALNKNTGVERNSDFNYLMEKKSNIIARYFMLTFKYRLNKFDSKGNVDIKVNKR